MQFSMFALTAALAATVSAQYAVNGTSATATGAVKPSGTGSVRPTSQAPFTGAATMAQGSAFGMIVAGGVALVSFVLDGLGLSLC
jgi:hypothetical protein